MIMKYIFVVSTNYLSLSEHLCSVTKCITNNPGNERIVYCIQGCSKHFNLLELTNTFSKNWTATLSL